MTMRSHLVGLLVPVLVLVALLGSTGAAVAQCGAGGGQLGPCPALLDTNRNGLPEPGVDQPITFDFQAANSSVTIGNPWTTNCGGGGNVVSFSRSDPNSPYFDTMSRNPNPNFMQTLRVTGRDTHGDPTQFTFSEWPSYKFGTATLVDDNEDGKYDHLRLESAGQPYLDVSFEGVSTLNNGAAQYVTVPWAQANLMGMNGTCKLPGGDPQIFLPAVNGRIVVGFSGFQPSPPIATTLLPTAAPVPALSEWGALILLLGLGFGGWMALRRSRALA
jgi:hypothetical protein